MRDKVANPSSKAWLSGLGGPEFREFVEFVPLSVISDPRVVSPISDAGLGARDLLPLSSSILLSRCCRRFVLKARSMLCWAWNRSKSGPERARARVKRLRASVRSSLTELGSRGTDIGL